MGCPGPAKATEHDTEKAATGDGLVEKAGAGVGMETKGRCEAGHREVILGLEARPRVEIDTEGMEVLKHLRPYEGIDPALKPIYDALEEAGYAPMLSGGAVRDAVLRTLLADGKVHIPRFVDFDAISLRKVQGLLGESIDRYYGVRLQESLRKWMENRLLQVVDKHTAEEGTALFVAGVEKIVGRLAGDEDAEKPAAPPDYDTVVFGIEEGIEEIASVLERFGRVQKAGKGFQVLKLFPRDPELRQRYHDGLDFLPPRKERRLGDDEMAERGISNPHLAFEIEVGTARLIEDAERRDFTIGAMYLRPASGTVYGPAGSLEDLRSGTLREVSPEHFGEDPQRFFRALRFAARFGFAISPELLQRGDEMAEEMLKQGPDVVVPRFRAEWNKVLLQGRYWHGWIRDAVESGWGRRMWPELDGLADLPQDPGHHPEGDVATHTEEVLEVLAAITRRVNRSDADALLETEDARWFRRAVAWWKVLDHIEQNPPKTKQALAGERRRKRSRKVTLEYLRRYLASVEEKAAAKYDDDLRSARRVLMAAALAHDIGKKEATAIGDDGRIHAYGHEESEETWRFVDRLGLNKRERQMVKHLIRLHMRPHLLSRNRPRFTARTRKGQEMSDVSFTQDGHATTKSLRRFLSALAERGIPPWMSIVLAYADKAGRVPARSTEYELRPAVAQRYTSLLDRLSREAVLSSSSRKLHRIIGGDFLKARGMIPQKDGPYFSFFIDDLGRMLFDSGMGKPQAEALLDEIWGTLPPRPAVQDKAAKRTWEETVRQLVRERLQDL